MVNKGLDTADEHQLEVEPRLLACELEDENPAGDSRNCNLKIILLPVRLQSHCQMQRFKLADELPLATKVLLTIILPVCELWAVRLFQSNKGKEPSKRTCSAKTSGCTCIRPFNELNASSY